MGAGAVVLGAPSLLLTRLALASPHDGPLEVDGSRLLVLIPAHDEAAGIAGCVESVLAQWTADPADVIVIADNCSDDTAERARAAGARVLIRTDPARPGKPWALRWTLEQVPLDPYDAVVIVDADTTIEPGFFRSLEAAGPLRRGAVQGCILPANEADNWLTLLAGLFARARYDFLYPLRARAGLNVPLTGNGMCIGADVLREGWQDLSLTEDLELYARLTASGRPIRYAAGARVRAEEARTLRQSAGQRERWARGRWGVFRRFAGPLLRSDAISTTQKADALLELGMPSPVIRLAASMAIIAIAAFALRGPLAVAGILGGVGLVGPDLWAIGGAFVRHPLRWRVLRAMLMVPPYALWRMALALRSAGRTAPVAWKRTARNVHD